MEALLAIGGKAPDAAFAHPKGVEALLAVGGKAPNDNPAEALVGAASFSPAKGVGALLSIGGKAPVATFLFLRLSAVSTAGIGGPAAAAAVEVEVRAGEAGAEGVGVTPAAREDGSCEAESACWGGGRSAMASEKFQNECRGDRAAEIISPRSAKIENYVPVTTVESSYVDIVPESTITSFVPSNLNSTIFFPSWRFDIRDTKNQQQLRI